MNAMIKRGSYGCNGTYTPKAMRDFFFYLFLCLFWVFFFFKNKSTAKTKFVRQLGHLNTVKSLRHFAGGGPRHENAGVRWCQIYRLTGRHALELSERWPILHLSPFAWIWLPTLCQEAVLLCQASALAVAVMCLWLLSGMSQCGSLHFNHIFTDSLGWLLGPLHKPKFISYGW